MVYSVECLAHVSYDYDSDFVVLTVDSGRVNYLVKGCDSAMAFSATMVIFIYYFVGR